MAGDATASRHALNFLNYSPVAHAFSDEMKDGQLGLAASLLESLQRAGCASKGTGRLDGVPKPRSFRAVRRSQSIARLCP
jgi:hypothetical protein